MLLNRLCVLFVFLFVYLRVFLQVAVHLALSDTLTKAFKVASLKIYLSRAEYLGAHLRLTLLNLFGAEALHS